MEVKESYRVLELGIGASRAEVDAAYCRLLEKWHPDRAATGGPGAVREAERMVQAINDAYNTLSKIAPNSTSPPPRAANVNKSSAPVPTNTAPPTGMKPRLPPLAGGEPVVNGPAPRPPAPETWAARAAPAPGAPPPSAPAPSPAPAAPAAPPPAAARAAPPPPATPPPASAPPPASPPEPVMAPPEFSEGQPATFIDRLRRMLAFYDTLFPVGSARRRFGGTIVVAAVVLVLILGKCAFSAGKSRRAYEPDPRTTGRLVVKSNLAGATVEATRLATASDASTSRAGGPVDQALAGLPPGKYNVTVHADGWPDVHGEVNIEAAKTAEVAMKFKSGSLRLDSDPRGAAVRLGENTLGQTPLVVPQLPPGECQLAIEYPSWPAVTFRTTITEGVESTATVRLPYGTVTVETTPPGATILLGRRSLGKTPLALEHFPAGHWKLTLQAKDFPALEVPVTVEDKADLKIHQNLGAGFPVLDATALLHSVWVPDNPSDSTLPFEGLSGPSAPHNGVIKNLDRKRLYENWLRKSFCYTATVKAYDRANGEIEFAEQQNEYSKYRILARLSTEARNDQELTAQLTKGATFAFYGRLTAVEEPRWLAKVITFEFSSAEPLR